jgi:ribosomal-protein-alanine N-acetyltransferase
MNEHGVIIRPGSIVDLAAVVALERATENAPHWPTINYAAILQSQGTNSQSQGPNSPIATPRRCLFVAQTTVSDAQAAVEAHAVIKGFAVGVVPPSGHDEVTAELESVAVAASARHAGIGRALCAAVLDWTKEEGAASIVLEVRAGSAPAIALYEGLSFVLAGRRPRYYRDPEDDALLMRLPLR